VTFYDLKLSLSRCLTVAVRNQAASLEPVKPIGLGLHRLEKT